MTEPVENLISRLHARRSGRGWVARCPAHQDHRPSLSINEGRDGRALLKCLAGCDTTSVLAALGLKHRDLFAGARSNVVPTLVSKTPPVHEFLSAQNCRRAIDIAETLRKTPNLCERVAQARGWKAETIRNLTCEPSLGWYQGKLAFIFETGLKFRWRQNGERIIKWAFGKPWLWRGSIIDTAATVYLTEGETDAISLIDAGLESDERTVAVALPSASTFNEEWAKYFAGREVVLAFDADNAGQEATRRVSRFLYPQVASLKQLNWGGLQHAM